MIYLHRPVSLMTVLSIKKTELECDKLSQRYQFRNIFTPLNKNDMVNSASLINRPLKYRLIQDDSSTNFVAITLSRLESPFCLSPSTSVTAATSTNADGETQKSSDNLVQILILREQVYR